MKRMTNILLLTFAIFFLAIPIARASDEDIKANLLKNIQGLWQGWKDQNPEPFKQWLAPNVLTVTTQSSLNFTDFMKQIESKECVVKSFSIDEAGAQLIRVDNDVVVITYRAEQDAMCAGKKVPSYVTVSEVWAEKDGKWKGYFYQETPWAK